MKVNPIIIVDDTLCYSLVKAQKVYEKNRKKKDKKEIRVAIYTHKGDVKPCHTFLVKTATDFTNLYLQICHIIYLKMERLQYLLYNEDMSETIRKQKEEEYELLKKYEDEAEEWYISYVIEKEREKEERPEEEKESADYHRLYPRRFRAVCYYRRYDNDYRRQGEHQARREL